MAINPAEVTTVRASELPPASPANESILVHELEGILNQMTLAELISFIGSQATYKQYELKCIRVPNEAYITDNFDMTPSDVQGIGKAGGLWDGWAICNGNNGTDNLDGQVLIGYGANFNTVGQFIGSPDSVIVAHTHSLASKAWATNNTDGLTTSDVIAGRNQGRTGYTLNGTSGDPFVQPAGEDGTDKNYQPSMVILMIMKL